MSLRKIAENFLFSYNAARNYNESMEVIDNMVKWLKKKKDQVDGLLKEVSKSKVMIRVLASEINMTTKSDKTKVDISYKPADIKKLQHSWDTLVELNEVIDRLESAIMPRALSMYKTVPGIDKHMEKTKSFVDACKESRDRLLSELRTSGNKQIPKYLKNLIESLETELSEGLKGRYKELNVMVYPNIAEIKNKNVLAYFCYLQFEGLKDDDEWVKEIFDVVVVAVPDAENNLQFQVHTFEGHSLPNEIDLTDGVWMSKITGVKNMIISRLTEVHALNMLRPTPLPITEKDLRKNPISKLQIVSKVAIVNDVLKVYLKPSVIRGKTAAEEAGIKIYLIVKNWFEIPKKAHLTLMQEQEGTQFILNYKISGDVANTGTKVSHDRSHILELGNKLGLNKTQINKLEDTYKGFLYNKKHKVIPQEYPGNLKSVEEYTDDEPISADRTKPNPALKLKPKTAVPAPKEQKVVPKPVPKISSKPTVNTNKGSKISSLLEKRRRLFKDLEDEDIEV